MKYFTKNTAENSALNTGIFHICMIIAILVCGFAGEVRAEKKSFLKRVEAYLDSGVIKGVDSNYVALPKKPWAVALKSDMDMLNLNVSSYDHDDDYNLSSTNKIKIKPPVNASIGLWAGYRGSGFGYSLSLSDNGVFNFGLSMVTPRYVLNFKISRFSFRNVESSYIFNLTDVHETSEVDLDEEFMNMFLSSPMKIGTVMIDGYWVFNRKRFSMPAAYDQSTIQLRSAGSVIAGLMYYYQKYDYNSPKNFLFIINTDNVGLMKIYQGSIGLGYTYNWVPVRGMVVNAVVMPVLTLLNKIKASRYEILCDIQLRRDSVSRLADTAQRHVGAGETSVGSFHPAS